MLAIIPNILCDQNHPKAKSRLRYYEVPQSILVYLFCSVTVKCFKLVYLFIFFILETYGLVVVKSCVFILCCRPTYNAQYVVSLHCGKKHK